jgi:hypothetical protein
MSQPASRLLARLDEAIAKAGDSAEGDCLRAEQAIYWARKGELERARKAVTEIRARYAARPRADVSAWVGLAEGLVMFFENVSELARDRVLRAQALARSAGQRRLDALSSAWLAHLDFMRLQPEAMRRNVETALNLSAADDHQVRARAAMVAGISFHFSGRRDRAQPWYSLAHWHATSDGDLMTVSALAHNDVTFRLANTRHARFRAEAAASEVSHLLMAADSNRQLDELLGATALNVVTPLIRGQALTLLGRFSEAAQIFASEMDLERSGMARWAALNMAERAWCEFKQGSEEVAKRLASAAREAIDPVGQPDDRAPAHSRLADLFRELGDVESSKSQQELAAQAWHQHEATQERMYAAFETLELPKVTS